MAAGVVTRVMMTDKASAGEAPSSLALHEILCRYPIDLPLSTHGAEAVLSKGFTAFKLRCDHGTKSS